MAFAKLHRSALLATLLLYVSTPHAVDAQVIRAALVKPWGGGTGGPVGPFWDDIANNWSAYGSMPITLDRGTFVSNTVTAAALAQTNPDVLVFADSTGNNATFSPQEQADIANFLASGGKRVVGTFISFQFGISDNRWLLPLFGLTPALNLLNGPHQGQALDIFAQTSPFMAGLPNPIPMSGYIESQYPDDLTWDPVDFGGNLLAASPNLRSIVHYSQGTNHDAVYISFMPEYGGNVIARQLVYNALAVARPSNLTITPLASPSIGTVLPLSLAAPDFPNAPYILGYSLSTAPGIPLSDGRTVPVTPDALFWFAGNPTNGIFLHTTGVLDGSGVANTWALIAIPPTPSLVGATVYAAMVTLDASSSSGVGGISFPLVITITN